MKTTKQILTPYEVVDHCPTCCDEDLGPSDMTRLYTEKALMTNSPKYMVSCPNCGGYFTQDRPPVRVEYKKGAFIT